MIIAVSFTYQDGKRKPACPAGSKSDKKERQWQLQQTRPSPRTVYFVVQGSIVTQSSRRRTSSSLCTKNAGLVMRRRKHARQRSQNEEQPKNFDKDGRAMKRALSLTFPPRRRGPSLFAASSAPLGDPSPRVLSRSTQWALHTLSPTRHGRGASN
jgi:hypothetical protein